MGLWFFDLPDAAERQAIWALNISKFGLSAQALPDSEGWSGANIRDCCDIAYSLGLSVVQAASRIVPAAVQDPEGVSKLRALANGRFLSASNPGYYKLAAKASPVKSGRAVVADLDSL